MEKARILTFENKMADVQTSLELWCFLHVFLPCAAIMWCSRQELVLDAVFALVCVALSRVQHNGKKNGLIWQKMFWYELPIHIRKFPFAKGE